VGGLVSPAGGTGRWWRRRALPEVLGSALDRDERIAVTATCEDGRLLAVSRFGLWVVSGPATSAARADRIGWELIARARLAARVLSVIPTRVVGRLAGEPDGADGAVDGLVDGLVDVLVDEAELTFGLSARSGLTDQVHSRVRRSVAASRHLPYPGAGGWVVLRRVPGRNGLTRQVRLDPGADVDVPGFADAVLAVADGLAETMPSR